MTNALQALDQNDKVIPNTVEPSGATQKLSSSGSSVRSTEYTSNTVLRIVGSADCHYKIGDSTVTAAATDVYLPGKVGEQIRVSKGKYVAMIASSADLYLTVCN